ncbi:PREDICTED: speckle targeted PIP5K1A-regulated poly(A) polymerase-like isoform X2 [Papilio polytes]|uniref:speckle targeted PIP5K1A-regulated poly(A) polymerase-like isoform X2 n=1 Tax=Papilio polytes TaxID=76194 RepID=UPI000675E804|nr:PREDICTED: speckle targeted PIP5K1A-regulated poly(A) polymerase-like isoform X2 [Papilio polytes]
MEDNQNAESSIVPNKVHVTGFPMYTQPQDLERVFSEYGEVKVDKITKRYATLEFNKVEGAKAAIKHSKKVAVYGELIYVRPYYTKPIANTQKKEKPQIDKGRKILSPHEILLSGEFDEQLENIMMAIRLTQEEVKQISELYSDLERVLQVAWPGCKAIPFGSITTGLGVKCSDADCFISIPQKLQHANNNYIMKARRVLLANKQLFSDIVPIPQAKIPIVKFYHIPTQRQCDVSFNSPQSIENSKLLAYFVQLDYRVKSLAILIKYWSKLHGLTGTNLMPNYAMILLVVFYLQQKSILPPVHSLQSNEFILDNWNVAFDDVRFASGNTDTLYVLLGGFFLYYKDFNYDKFIISLYLGKPISKESFSTVGNEPPEYRLYKENLQNNKCKPLRTDSLICLQDPFDHSRNCTVAVYARLANKLFSYISLGATAYEIEESDTFLRAILSMSVQENPVVTKKVGPRCIAKNKPANKKKKAFFHEAFLRARQKSRKKHP